MTENGGIGYHNDMLYYIGEDLQRFRALTMHKTIIMGRKTFLSLKRPLPNLHHIVVSRDPRFTVSHEQVDVVSDLLPVLNRYQVSTEEVFVIGGGSVYDQAMPYCHRLYLTINDGTSPADVFYPPIDRAQWFCIEHTDLQWDDKSQVHYWYETLERK